MKIAPTGQTGTQLAQPTHFSFRIFIVSLPVNCLFTIKASINVHKMYPINDVNAMIDHLIYGVEWKKIRLNMIDNGILIQQN